MNTHRIFPHYTAVKLNELAPGDLFCIPQLSGPLLAIDEGLDQESESLALLRLCEDYLVFDIGKLGRGVIVYRLSADWRFVITPHLLKQDTTILRDIELGLICITDSGQFISATTDPRGYADPVMVDIDKLCLCSCFPTNGYFISNWALEVLDAAQGTWVSIYERESKA